MRALGLLLTLVVLLATNGLAITKHHCLFDILIEHSEPVEDDGCCHSEVIDFVKQDVVGQIATHLEVADQLFLVIDLFFTHEVEAVSSNFTAQYFNKPPPALATQSELMVVAYQNFRC